MKKVLFLMFLLFLIGLGTASLKAQVRIGGNTAPQGAAVLDLNADNTATPAVNKGALALPRVALTSTTMQLNGTTPINGMLVYNTGGSLSAGVYFFNGSNWQTISGDGVIGNELTDTIAGGGLTKTGSGTAASPWKVGIAPRGVKPNNLDLDPGTSMLATDATTFHRVQFSIALSTGITISANGYYDYTVPLGSCLSMPILVPVGATPSGFTWSRTGSVGGYNYRVYNLSSVQATVTMQAMCWEFI